jgi:hypothetical protein
MKSIVTYLSKEDDKIIFFIDKSLLGGKATLYG